MHVCLQTQSARIASRRLANTQALNASTLVIAEHANGTIAATTLSTVKAAQAIGGNVTVLVYGNGVGDVAKKAAAIGGVSKVLVADKPHLGNAVAEDVSKLAHGLTSGNAYTHVLAASTNTGKNYIPRVAALLDVSPLSDVSAVVDENTFKRPMYAGNAIATVKMTDKVKVMTIRATAFDKAADAGGSATVEDVSGTDSTASLSTFVSANVVKSERPDLNTAKVVVSGGRGMKSGDNFKLLDALADKLGGAVGASRAAVDAGMVPNDYQIGQTGKVVAPQLYIAVGISGAIQHLSGMKDSKTIVAINKDKDAPIFQVADFGLVEDLFKAVPELTSKL